MVPATVALLCAWATPSMAEETRRVGVVVTVVVGVEKPALDATISALASALRSEVGVDVIAGADVTRRLPPDGLPDACVASAECRNDLGRRLDADELLLLVVARVGDDVQIDSSWADVASGRTNSRPRIVLSSAQDTTEIFRQQAPALLPHLKRPEPKQIVVIAPGAQQAERSSRQMSAPAWVALGVGGAGIAGGTIFALTARSKFNSLERDNCRELPCDKARVDSGKSHALAADVLFAVGVFGLTTATVLYAVSYAVSEPNEPAIGAAATSEFALVTISGAF